MTIQMKRRHLLERHAIPIYRTRSCLVVSLYRQYNEAPQRLGADEGYVTVVGNYNKDSMDGN